MSSHERVQGSNTCLRRNPKGSEHFLLKADFRLTQVRVLFVDKNNTSHRNVHYCVTEQYKLQVIFIYPQKFITVLCAYFVVCWT